VPVPTKAVEAIIGRVGPELVTVIRGQGIVIVDLRPWLPADSELKVISVQATPRSLHVWLGSGQVDRVPGQARPGLPSGEP